METTAKSLERLRQRVARWLDDLSPESLSVVEQLVKLLREKKVDRTSPAPTDSSSYLYPSVLVPASSLLGLTALLQNGYDGDALADTEAIYDE